MRPTILYYNKHTNEQLGTMSADNLEPFLVEEHRQRFAKENDLDVSDVGIQSPDYEEPIPKNRLKIRGNVYGTANPLDEEIIIDLVDELSLSVEKGPSGMTIITIGSDTFAFETHSLKFELVI